MSVCVNDEKRGLSSYVLEPLRSPDYQVKKYNKHLHTCVCVCVCVCLVYTKEVPSEVPPVKSIADTSLFVCERESTHTHTQTRTQSFA